MTINDIQTIMFILGTLFVAYSAILLVITFLCWSTYRRIKRLMS